MISPGLYTIASFAFGLFAGVTTLPAKESAVTAIRIFDADPVGDDQPDSPSLESVFSDHLMPEMEARNQATKLRQYKNSIARFTAFLDNAANTTSIRGIREITDLHAIQWQQSEVEKGLAPSTINVHWTRIRAVFRRAGPAEKGNPQGLAIIPRVPYLRPLPVPKPRPKVVGLDVIEALYVYGTPDMTWPDKSHGIPAALRWRAWLVCTYNLAMRTRDLLSLRWESVHTDPRSLNPESTNENPWGWVEWIPAKTRNSKPDPLVLPMNQWVRSHLDAIRCEDPYVFGRKMATVGNDMLYGRKGRPGSGQWTRLVDLASTHAGVKRFEIKTIRKTANTEYNRLDRQLGSHILGHAPRGVNDMYYQQWESDVIRFVGLLPQPPSFKKPPVEPFRQELMF